MADTRFVAIRKSDDQHESMRGWRLRVERESVGFGGVIISEERVHPEQISNPDARFVAEADVISLTWDEFMWVRAQLDAIHELDSTHRVRKLLGRVRDAVGDSIPQHLLDEVEEEIRLGNNMLERSAAIFLDELADEGEEP